MPICRHILLIRFGLYTLKDCSTLFSEEAFFEHVGAAMFKYLRIVLYWRMSFVCRLPANALCKHTIWDKVLLCVPSPVFQVKLAAQRNISKHSSLTL